MRLALTFLMLSLLLAACGHRDQSQAVPADAKLRKALTGSWVQGTNLILTLAPDGSFVSVWTNSPTKPGWSWKYEGTWGVAEGAYVATVTNSRSWGSTNRDAVGTVGHCRIIALDDRELTWECEGQTISFSRRR